MNDENSSRTSNGCAPSKSSRLLIPKPHGCTNSGKKGTRYLNDLTKPRQEMRSPLSPKKAARPSIAFEQASSDLGLQAQGQDTTRGSGTACFIQKRTRGLAETPSRTDSSEEDSTAVVDNWIVVEKKSRNSGEKTKRRGRGKRNKQNAAESSKAESLKDVKQLLQGGKQDKAKIKARCQGPQQTLCWVDDATLVKDRQVIKEDASGVKERVRVGEWGDKTFTWIETVDPNLALPKPGEGQGKIKDIRGKWGFIRDSKCPSYDLFFHMSELQEDQRDGIIKGASVRYTIKQDPWRNERKSKFKAIGICRTLGRSDAAKRLHNNKNHGAKNKSSVSSELELRKKKSTKSRKDFLRSLSSKAEASENSDTDSPRITRP